MSDVEEVRGLLNELTDSLRAHLEAVERSTGEADAAVHDAFERVQEAFLAYEDALYDVHDEVVPMSVVEYLEEDAADDEDPAAHL